MASEDCVGHKVPNLLESQLWWFWTLPGVKYTPILPREKLGEVIQSPAGNELLLKTVASQGGLFELCSWFVLSYVKTIVSRFFRSPTSSLWPTELMEVSVPHPAGMQYHHTGNQSRRFTFALFLLWDLYQEMEGPGTMQQLLAPGCLFSYDVSQHNSFFHF